MDEPILKISLETSNYHEFGKRHSYSFENFINKTSKIRRKKNIWKFHNVKQNFRWYNFVIFNHYQCSHKNSPEILALFVSYHKILRYMSSDFFYNQCFFFHSASVLLKFFLNSTSTVAWVVLINSTIHHHTASIFIFTMFVSIFRPTIACKIYWKFTRFYWKPWFEEKL